MHWIDPLISFFRLSVCLSVRGVHGPWDSHRNGSKFGLLMGIGMGMGIA